MDITTVSTIKTKYIEFNLIAIKQLLPEFDFAPDNISVKVEPQRGKEYITKYTPLFRKKYLMRVFVQNVFVSINHTLRKINTDRPMRIYFRKDKEKEMFQLDKIVGCINICANKIRNSKIKNAPQNIPETATERTKVFSINTKYFVEARKGEYVNFKVEDETNEILETLKGIEVMKCDVMFSFGGILVDNRENEDKENDESQPIFHSYAVSYIKIHKRYELMQRVRLLYDDIEERQVIEEDFPNFEGGNRKRIVENDIIEIID